MRIANLDNRAALVLGETGAEQAVDIATASEGRFGPDVADLYSSWAELQEWVAGLDTATLPATDLDRSRLNAPSPAPRQVFAIGLNYDEHAAESGFDSPTHLPPVFTKYVSSFSGPDTEVTIPTDGNVDWEVELVVIIGRQGHRIDAADAWDHVAGLTVGQDISERVSQLRGPAPQFGLGKSFPGFSPQGPWLVTPDEVGNPDDLELGCTIDGETVQKGRTSELIFPVAELIAGLSNSVTLYPGDVIFSGTPAGVGVGRSPQRFLKAGEQLHTWVEGIGDLNQRFVAAPVE
ncbi:2-keto-4-pentenoate hydratase/2-oxohepta-3-ene-1,7-dioic acid hydratase (catechol pathway) [Raineyella antarctica]|uniref:2-keto-4-pentenoate hydratase/2-oxohepta-3-ene-1,7-dioic acid hydratase (Catechol pathway) n=1 Tax=Raineyella antarctica TaxID=1577474 RepID=A0A1G6ID41_9ACTN|nr:fumarylacetoacetate hydrolase family protein [Raineyella antarctica]SDC04283.1 2-keto-4-pentenoate hydratase/2-oxohepta-3-ene-1,7-dioic acid hydratase (catechol pathway) [Raineyella antarctica]